MVVEVKVYVRNELGLHARPAAMLVQAANEFRSQISAEKGGQKVNAKSIMGVMMLAAGKGSKITLTANGKDAKQAIKKLIGLFENRFGEE